MSDSFDPYYQWLAIPPRDQPPNRYRLLGIELFEENPAVIENAANQRMAHLRTFQNGPHGGWSQRILNELAAARICLLNPEKKADYDRSLRQELALRSPGYRERPGGNLAGALPVPPARPQPLAFDSQEPLSSRLRQRSRTWQTVLAVTGVLAACAVGLLVLNGGGRQEDVPIAERPLRPVQRPVHEEPAPSAPGEAAEPPPAPEVLAVPAEESLPATDSPRVKPEIPPPAAPLAPAPMVPAVETPPEPQNGPAEFEAGTAAPGAMMEASSPAPVPVPSAESQPSADGRPVETSENTILENAAARGLKWLAAQQREDGSWSFQTGPNPGRLNQTMGATAMALLPLLRYGSTHRTGEYSEHVGRGLKYLLARAQLAQNGANLQGGDLNCGMYVHALATIAICQAYLQTKDRELRSPSQLAVNFIVDAQDPKGGGWRYKPRQPGDTSVLGWQITALACAREAKLKVPQVTLARAAAYLDSVQSENGRAYGYERRGHGTPATTAIGLLCRTCLGWDKDTPALQDGVRGIAVQGPSDDIYHNFYATRLLAIWGQADQKSSAEKPEWKTWKEQMRTRILDTQQRFGEAEGSWFTGRGLVNERAGRLGVTSMTLMTFAAVALEE